jgi:uncharacterized protein
MFLRNFQSSVKQDLSSKLVLLSGPRQVGKTTFSRQLTSNVQYLNFDDEDHRRIIHNKTWDRDNELIIFDELHKKPKWKSWIKGVYDTETRPPAFLVTGSARLDVFKRGGDSLAGRHHSYRLHPFSVAELATQMSPTEAFDTIMRVGGFPEPFLSGSEDFAKRWRRTHIDRIIKEDLLDLEQVRQLRTLDLLVDLLSERVGSPVSYNSLARDLEVSPHTIKHWIEILQVLYVIFVVPPYTKNVARSLLKEPKIYFYDNGKVRNEPGVRLENMMACALLKDLQRGEDLRGEKNQLSYIRDKEKREVDFAVVRDGKLERLIEVKVGDESFSKNLYHFQERLKPKEAVQVVRDLSQKSSTPTLKMVSAVNFLMGLES